MKVKIPFDKDIYKRCLDCGKYQYLTVNLDLGFDITIDCNLPNGVCPVMVIA